MELRRYAQILRRRWVAASLAFLVTLFGTLGLVMPQPWFYVSTGSVVVTPRSGLSAEDAIRAAETLYGNTTIPSTFAQLAGSDTLIALAKDGVQSKDPYLDTSEVTVETAVVIDTDVITISVTHTDPDVAREMAVALVDQMLLQKNTLASVGQGLFVVQKFDDPNLPDAPAGPNKKLMIAAGLVLGALLALGLALLAEYLKRPAEELAIDDPVTGLRNEIYLRERLHEEMSRTQRTRHSTAICLLRVGIRTGENDDIAHAPTPRDLRRIARGLRLTVPGDAVLAALPGGMFVTLLPDVSRAKADGLRDGWEAAIRALLDWASQGEIGPRLNLTGGTGEIVRGALTGSAEIEAALRPLAGPDLMTGEMETGRGMLPGAAQGALPEPSPEPSPEPAFEPEIESPRREAPRQERPQTPASRAAAPAETVMPEMPAAPPPQRTRAVATPAPPPEPAQVREPDVVAVPEPEPEPEVVAAPETAAEPWQAPEPQGFAEPVQEQEPEIVAEEAEAVSEPEIVAEEAEAVSEPQASGEPKHHASRPSSKRRRANRLAAAAAPNGDGDGAGPDEVTVAVDDVTVSEDARDDGEPDRVEAGRASAREG